MLLDWPLPGREFFEEIIRDKLGFGAAGLRATDLRQRTYKYYGSWQAGHHARAQIEAPLPDPRTFTGNCPLKVLPDSAKT